MEGGISGPSETTRTAYGAIVVAIFPCLQYFRCSSCLLPLLLFILFISVSLISSIPIFIHLYSQFSVATLSSVWDNMHTCVVNVYCPCLAKWSVASPLPTYSLIGTASDCGKSSYHLGYFKSKEFQVSAISCEVSIDGIACEHCQIVSCESGSNAGQGIEVFCTTAGIPFDLNTCDALPSSDGVYQVLTSSGFDRCFACDASATCFNQKMFEESSDASVKCKCTERANGRILLSCVDQSCLLCDNSLTLCGYSGFGSTFDELGRVVSTLLGFQYFEGWNDFAAFHKCHGVLLGVSKGPDECLVTVNYEECSSCDSISCSNENGESEKFQGFSVNCDNIQDGASFSGNYLHLRTGWERQL
jgi:hypothetical protein